MAVTNVRGRQLRDDDVTRADLNITTSGSAVIRKIIQGTGLSFSSTGVDSGTGDVTITLATSGVTANTYGSATQVPVITVDTYGRITSVTLESIAGITLTTTGTSGVATFSSNTLNIPNYSVTADNGVSIATGNIIQLGSPNTSGVPLADNRWINTGSNYLTVRGNSSNQTFIAVNFGTGYAFTAESVGPSARLFSAPSSTNSIATVMSIARGTSGTAAAGIGSALEFEVQTSSSGMYVSGRIANILTNTSSVPSSKFQFDVLNASVYLSALTLEATGRLVANQYGAGTFTGTSAYYLAVTSTGQIIEVATPGGGSGTVTGTGTSGQIAYWNGTSSQTGSATLTYTPTSALFVNNSVTAATAIARGINFTPTVVAAANNDVLVGLDINPTFTNGAFTGVSNWGIRNYSSIRFETPNGSSNQGLYWTPANDGTQVGVFASNYSVVGFNTLNAMSGPDGLVVNGNERKLTINAAASSVYLDTVNIIISSHGTGEAMRIVNATKNVLIGTTSDTGLYKLDVNGQIRASSRVLSGLGGFTNNCLYTYISNHCGSAGYIGFGFQNVADPAASDSVFDIYQGPVVAPIANLFNIKHSLLNASVDLAQAILGITTTINQSATATGNIRGIYYNPTVTNVIGNHYAWESTSGKFKISDLAGTGTRMVVADATGVLSTQAIPGGGGGSGTVTSVSVVSANGFAGSVATNTTTPAITLSTTVTGLLKGNGTAISAAVANTDYQKPLVQAGSGTQLLFIDSGSGDNYIRAILGGANILTTPDGVIGEDLRIDVFLEPVVEEITSALSPYAPSLSTTLFTPSSGISYTHTIFHCDTSAGSVVIDLPELGTGNFADTKVTYTVKHAVGGNTLTVNGFTGQTIDGGASAVIGNHESITLYPYNNNWYII